MSSVVYTCMWMFDKDRNRTQLAISTGKLVAKNLNDTDVKTVYSVVLPEMRQKKYGEAMELAVVDVGLAVSTAFNFTMTMMTILVAMAVPAEAVTAMFRVLVRSCGCFLACCQACWACSWPYTAGSNTQQHSKGPRLT